MVVAADQGAGRRLSRVLRSPIRQSMILVTGATGFAGSHLLDRLAGESPIAAWAHAGGRRSQHRRDVEWHDVDLLNRRSVSQAMAAIAPDTIYHLAGTPHVGSSFDNPSEPLAINALGTHYLLAAIEAYARNARVVVVTSAMIYGPAAEALTESSPVLPDSPYALSKLAQDRLALLAAAQGLNIIVARPFNHTGPKQAPSFAIPGFAQQIARIEAGQAAPVIHVGNLDAERDLTDVRDVVSGYATL